MNYLRYYDLEAYLFDHVTHVFQQRGHLTGFEFFSIVRWRTNGATTQVARRLTASGHTDLEAAVQLLTTEIADAESNKEKLEILLVKWGFRLPLASAILTVCYPEVFALYDTRVCDELGAFHELANKRKFANIWEGYSDYIRAVQQAGPSRLTLRDKDRWLTARLAYHDLMTKVAQGFESEKGEGKREKAPPHHPHPAVSC
jgi:hypothetical protein